MKNQSKLDNFKNFLSVNGYSNIYENCIRLFLQYLETNNIDIYVFDYNLFNQYLLYLKQKKVSNGYINNFIKAIRKFYEFLVNSEGINPQLLEGLKKIKLLTVDRIIKDIVTEKELKLIVSNAITFCRRTEYTKLKAFLYFLFYTGLRASEILNLKRVDVNLLEGEAIVRVPTKNRQERYVYFPPKISKLLARYFEVEPEETNAFNMNYTQVRYLIKKINKCFQDKKLSAHSFRHSFANMLVEKEIGIRVAQKLLGHKSMASTQIYYDPDTKLVKKIYNKHVTGIIEKEVETQPKEI